MILVDTSVWVEFLRRRRPLFDLVRRILEEGEALAAEPVFGELLQGARDENEREVILEYWRHLPKAAVSEVWIKAGEESAKHKWSTRGVGLIDAALIVIAREKKARLWTLDKKLKGLLRGSEAFD